MLREHNVAHVFNSWTRMPPIGAQLDLEGSITADFVVARALLKPGRLYEDAVKLFKPYDRIRDPFPDLRRDLARLARTVGGAALAGLADREQPRGGERPAYHRGGGADAGESIKQSKGRGAGTTLRRRCRRLAPTRSEPLSTL